MISTLNITTRKARTEDVDKLHELFEVVTFDTFAREGLANLVDEITNTVEEKKVSLKKSLQIDNEKTYLIIALVEEEIVGTIVCSPCSDLIKECTNGEIEDVYEMGTVYVLPKYQGMGIGTRLIEEFYKKLMELGEEEFCLDSGYKIAGTIWKKIFGQPEYILKNYWDKDYDHLVWHIKLIEIL